jgi:YD repeat-containing protein
MRASDQVTEYEYGVTSGDSPVASSVFSNRLLRRAIYPEQFPSQAATDRDVLFAYNAQGQLIAKTDQTGTTIETVYDTAGRKIHRLVTNIHADLDDTVRRITMTYNSRGQVETVTQFDTTTIGDPDTSGVLDQVRYTYDDWGLVRGFLIARTADSDADGDVDGADATYHSAYDERWRIVATYLAAANMCDLVGVIADALAGCVGGGAAGAEGKEQLIAFLMGLILGSGSEGCLGGHQPAPPPKIFGSTSPVPPITPRSPGGNIVATIAIPTCPRGIDTYPTCPSCPTTRPDTEQFVWVRSGY